MDGGFLKFVAENETVEFAAKSVGNVVVSNFRKSLVIGLGNVPVLL